MAATDAHVLELAGREVRITSPGKVLFSERGETKLDLVRYYAAVAGPLMRAMGGRPVLMQRFPQGAGGPSFFQKRVPAGAPDWLRTTTVQTVNGTPSRALVAADVAHVAWAAMTSARDGVPLTVWTVVVSSHAGALSGTRFWKNDGPPAPLGKRCMSTGRPPILRAMGSPTRR